MKININMENHTHELQIQKLKGELEALGKVFPTTYMVN
jgi:hypothetical protein